MNLTFAASLRWLLALVLLMIGSLIGWDTYSVHTAVKALESERLINQAGIIDRNLGRQLLATDSAMNSIRSELPLLQTQDNSMVAINRRLQSMREALPGMRALTLFDANGTLTARSPNQFVGQNFSTRDYFQIARKGADPTRLYVSPPFMTATGELSINVVKVLTDEKGGFAGIISASLGPDYFNTLLDSILYAKDMRAVLIQGDGKIAFRTHDPSNFVDKDGQVNPDSFLARHLRSAQPTSVFSGITSATITSATQEDRLVVFHTLNLPSLALHQPLIIVVSRDRAVVFSAWHKDLVLHGGLFAALVTGSVLGLLYLQRRQRADERLKADQQTERLRLEALHTSAAFKQTILNSIVAEIAVLDRNGTIQMVNEPWRRFALDNGEPPGQPVSGTGVGANYLAVCEPVQGDPHQVDHQVCNGIRAVLAGSQTRFEIEYPCHSPRQQRWFHMSVTPLDEGDQGGVVVMHTDISARKRSEIALHEARDEAERANRAKSNFLAHMSHELRTPMNSILGFAQLMVYDATLPAVHQDHVREILNAGQHLLRLINEILELARIESGSMTLSMQTVEVDTVVQECLHLIGPVQLTHGIAITYDPSPGAAVGADRMRLRQVVLNLLSNAIKYNRLGGSVRVQVQAQGASHLRIVVTDTGVGIPAARLGELFQPFSRLEQENGPIEGTGIGLSIVRHLAAMMEGTVGVTSEVGTGSSFWVELARKTLPLPDPTPTPDLLNPVKS